ncbi:MAG: glycosyltransferase family 2 protein [bacterium]|nr:glycosyltransferase family 2 protein [bacterium]
MPKFSIVIVNFYSGLLTKACIQSVRKTYAGSDYEVMVVDNDSKDDSREILTSEIDNIKVKFTGKNLGYAKAVNIALRETTGEYIILLNPDIIALKGGIAELIKFMDENPKVGIASGQLINPNGSVQDSSFRFYKPMTILYRRTFFRYLPLAKRHLDKIFMRDVDFTKNQKVDWVLGACMCIRRSAVEKVGPMDERFFLYFEDMDWCRRFWEQGFEVWYVPQARFAHYHKRESAQEQGAFAFLNPVARIHIASGIKYFLKYRKKNGAS